MPVTTTRLPVWCMTCASLRAIHEIAAVEQAQYNGLPRLESIWAGDGTGTVAVRTKCSQVDM